jgi:phosphoribosylformimino-5-aminoimidazole carboxamide ribotide isomerase
MLIIPVIDLSRGLVVHAIQGQRETYQPITSVISESAEPEVVLSSFFELYPFKIIYIADLDAIKGTGEHSKLILKLASQYKQCEFWVDAGIESIHNKSANYSIGNIKFVLGSENKLSEKSLSSILSINPNMLLSLDFDEFGLIENPYLLKNTSIWPKRLIVMMLSRVGSNTGIDSECLSNILKLSDNNDVYAAGGVRDMNDLIQLKNTNTKGILLATALHTGVITKDDLHQFLDA